MADGADGSGRATPADAALGDDGRLLRRVRLRLVLWSGGATLLVLLAVGLTVRWVTQEALAAAGTAPLRERVTLVERFLATEGDGAALPPLELYFGGPGSGTFAFLIPDGSEPLRPQAVEAPTGPSLAGAAAAREAGEDVRTETRDGVSWRFLTVAGREQLIVPGLGGEIAYLIQVVADRTAEQQALDTLLLALVIAGAVALLGAGLLGALYAERALVPIRAALASRRAALRRQREFAADASHELRTPLATIRAGVELLRRSPAAAGPGFTEALDDLDAEAVHLTRLVDDLLLLARADSGALDLVMEPLELGDLVTEAVAALAPGAERQGSSLAVDPAPVLVLGDPLRLRQLVTILVDNALRHGGPGRPVEIAVTNAGAGARIVVRDHGPGIRPEDLARVFDRFWRAPGRRTEGSGLGLAIAAAIVTRHGGRIGVANLPGGGAAFTVEIPLAGASGNGHDPAGSHAPLIEEA